MVLQQTSRSNTCALNPYNGVTIGSPTDEAMTPKVKKNRRKLRAGDTLRQNKKTVSFSKRVMVRRSLHLNNYTRGEIEATWYNEQEYLDMKRFTRTLVSILEQRGTYEQSVVEGEAGLVQYTRKGRRLRAQRKQDSRDRVLDEQQHQLDCGIQDADWIAYVYGEVTYMSRRDAFETATSFV